MYTFLLQKANSPYFKAILGSPLQVIEDAGSKNSYQFKTSIKKNSFPIHKGQVVGKIDVFFQNNKISTAPLISDRDVSLLSLWELYQKSIINLFFGMF